MNMNINRRNLLAGAGALVVSVTLPGTGARAAPWLLDTGLLKPEQLATYISINQDGSAALAGKVDMGQGTDIGWIKMIAEELDLPTDRVSMVQGHSDQTINMGGASGSTGIWKGGAALRNAAAEARHTLLEMASEKLGVPVDRLTVIDGVVSDKNDAGKKVSYGELIGGRQFNVELEWNKVIGNDLMVKGKTKPKAPSEYKTAARWYAPARHRPEGARYHRVHGGCEGARHAARRMIRPAIAGSVPTAVDELLAKDISVKVARQDYVVAPKEWNAIRVRKAQSHLVGCEAAFPEPGPALRPHPQGSSG